MPSKASNRALSVALESISRLKIPRPVAAALLGNASRPPDRLHRPLRAWEVHEHQRFNFLRDVPYNTILHDRERPLRSMRAQPLLAFPKADLRAMLRGPI